MRTLLLALTLLAAGTAPPARAEGKPPGRVVAIANGLPITEAEFNAAASRKTPADGTQLSFAEKAEVLDSLVTERLLYLEALRLGFDKDPKVQQVMVNALLRESVYSTVRNSDFTEADLRVYFDAHREEFVVAEKVQIKRILVKVGALRSEEKARVEVTRLREKLRRKPESFKEVAAMHSEDAYRRRGGDLGFVAREGKPGLPSEVVEMAGACCAG